MMVEKYIREDGKVAVLVSPEYGAGWSTEAYQDHEKGFLLFDKTLVEMFLEFDSEEPKNEHSLEIFKEKVNAYLVGVGIEIYLGGLSDVCVEWLNPGTEFVVNQNDGHEWLVLKEETPWIVC
jgi:hypothetical protein